MPVFLDLRADGGALNGRAASAQQRTSLPVARSTTGSSLLEVADRCVECNGRERRPLVKDVDKGLNYRGSSGANVVPCSFAEATNQPVAQGFTPATRLYGSSGPLRRGVSVVKRSWQPRPAAIGPRTHLPSRPTS